ncbi:MAG: efflux RND transporter periplasmic adaptor subunit [Bacteroidaceae bacterium]|nr:efflux RND transporter periplasmic adaptor subunit [Bacteroidaceae bacterium]
MKKIVCLSMALAALMAFSSCGEQKEEKKKDDAKPEVKLAQVETRLVPQTETYTATVESDVKNNIAPNTPYRIEKIYVEVGDHVRRGQVLVQLDASNLRQLKLQIENQKVEFNRTSQLFSVGGASQAEYDNAKTQLDVLSTQYAQLVQNTQLTAPISGVVTARNYDNGDMYSGTPILTVEQLNPVKLLINVSEVYYKNVVVGQPVEVALDAYEGEVFAGKVSIIYPTVDKTTHTFPVEVTVANSTQKVRPGMFARATISFEQIERVMVPDMAIVKQVGAGDRYVYTYKDGKVSYDKVELGKHMGEQYEVKSGVEPGAQVVVAGMSRLANGREVTVVK